MTRLLLRAMRFAMFVMLLVKIIPYSRMRKFKLSNDKSLRYLVYQKHYFAILQICTGMKADPFGY